MNEELGSSDPAGIFSVERLWSFILFLEHFGEPEVALILGAHKPDSYFVVPSWKKGDHAVNLSEDGFCQV